MSKNERRDSSVPRGTFGSSVPPQRSTAPSSERTLSAPQDAGDAARADQEARRKRYTNTLLGHPAGPSEPAATSPGSVLSPPKWRGAQAYADEAEQPQPRMSSIPTPTLGQPPVEKRASMPPEPAPLARVRPRPMLVSSASRPQTSEAFRPTEPELSQAIEELSGARVQAALPELPLDDVLEAFEEPEPPPPPVASPPPPPPPPPSASAQEPMRIEEQAIAVAPLRPAIAEPAEPEIEVDLALPAAPPSLAPAERPSREPDRAASPRGFLLVAAMLLIGGGFWGLTRGSYSGPMVGRNPPATTGAAAAPANGHESAQAPAPAKSSNESPVAAPALVPAKAPDTRPAVPNEAAAKPVQQPSTTTPSRTRRASAARNRAETESVADGRPPVLKVTPRAETLPETPSRDDVLAALEPVRAGVGRCAPGMVESLRWTSPWSTPAS